MEKEEEKNILDKIVDPGLREAQRYTLAQLSDLANQIGGLGDLKEGQWSLRRGQERILDSLSRIVEMVDGLPCQGKAN